MERYYRKSYQNKLGISTDDEKEIDLNFKLKTRDKEVKYIYENNFPLSDGDVDMGPDHLKIYLRPEDYVEIE